MEVLSWTEVNKGETLSDKIFRRQTKSMASPWLLVAAILLTGAICYVATISHNVHNRWIYVTVSATLVLFATVVPMWFERVITNGAAFQLGVVAWRMGTLLPALYFARLLDEPARNCMLITLMACYFVALPLESWLLALKAQNNAS
jgi:hypothetical protein